MISKAVSLPAEKNQLFDSATKYCDIKTWSFEKADYFLNQIITGAKRNGLDSVLAEVYYLKAENYTRAAVNYTAITIDIELMFGEYCEYCKPQNLDFASLYTDSVFMHLFFRNNGITNLREKTDLLISHIRSVRQEIEMRMFKGNLKISNERNTFYILIMVILAIVIILIIVFLYINRKKNKKIKLLLQNIEHKNKEVTDSINYAKRIQDAVMTSEKYIHTTLHRLTNNNK